MNDPLALAVGRRIIGFAVLVLVTGVGCGADGPASGTAADITVVQGALNSNVVVTVVGATGTPQAGIQVKAQRPNGTFAATGTTNSSGQKTFSLAAGSYRFVFPNNGLTIASGAHGHCVTPSCTAATITIHYVDVTVTNTGGVPQEGHLVKWDTGSDEDAFVETGANGHAIMALPPDGYRFKVYLNGWDFVSGPVDHCVVPTCTTAAITLTDEITVTVVNLAGVPQQGYLVKWEDSQGGDGAYNGSDGNGEALVSVLPGNYRFAVRCGGSNSQYFYSSIPYNCVVPGCTSAQVVINCVPCSPNGSACNDNNACTQSATCMGGYCNGTNPITCSAQDQCHVAGTCNPSTGVCSNPNKPNGTACSDSNACTQTDTCQSGACSGGNPVTCTASDQCHDVGVCNPGTGICSNPNKPNGTACNDSSACTQTDTCQAGACSGGNPVTCTALDQCHVAGTCDPATGACSNPQAANGTTCNDGNACTTGDSCLAGVCAGSGSQACGFTPPPLDPTIATDFVAATAFLYSGPNPIQTGVATGTIKPLQASVIRGRVTEAAGGPIAGVTIKAHGHAEFGQTVTRADGMFDLAVNGGGIVTIDYAMSGRLPVQRQVHAPKRDYVWAPDVVLSVIDPEMTVVNLDGMSGMQVAQGSPVVDQDGTRQATLLIPEDTAATMVLPDGTSTPLAQISVRATEYTVGPAGPRRMPAPLPASSGYTYALEYSVDEALTAGAKRVQFSQPLIHYVENFIGFPSGGIVPVGYYDRELAAWIPSDNGRVIKVVETFGGLAELDTNGDDVADDAATLAALGVTDSERAQVASLYMPGQTLWRVPIPHFTPYDCNWPYVPPPNVQPPPPKPPKKKYKPQKKPNVTCGSIIECEDQVLRETIPITGAPFTLDYSSRRMPGFRGPSRLEIPVTGPDVHPDVRSIEVEVQIAGRRIVTPITTAANQDLSFEWDGNDGYGRPVQGPQAAQVLVRYIYPATYSAPVPNMSQSFGLPSDVMLNSDRQALEFHVERRNDLHLGRWDVPTQERIGGWGLSVHHTYSPDTRELALGSGTAIDGEAIGAVITRIAGKWPGEFNSADGGLATDTGLGFVGPIALAPDGTLYASIDFRIRKVGSDGIIRPAAGGGSVPDYLVDGLPATEWGLFPHGEMSLATGPDGSLFVGTEASIKRIGPDGIVRPVAGLGGHCIGSGSTFSGDGGPATEAGICLPNSLTVTNDGTLYFADRFNRRIRRITPDGTITTVAGNGVAGSPADGSSALNSPVPELYNQQMHVGPDGVIYFTDVYQVGNIRMIGTDGIVRTFAGPSGVVPIACPPPGADALYVSQLRVGADNSVYFWHECPTNSPATRISSLIQKIGTDRQLTTVAGSYDHFAPGITGGFDVTAAKWPVQPHGMAIDGANGLVFSGLNVGNRAARDFSQTTQVVYQHSSHAFVYRVSPGLPGVTTFGETGVPSPDGSQVYIFNPQGRHLRTVDSLTGALKYRFNYSTSGLVSTVEDGDGLLTTIERDSNGTAQAIVAANGQRTTLALGSDGFLAHVTDPAGTPTSFTYGSGGLLATQTDRRGGQHTYTFDSNGLLTKDENPVGGFWDLVRTETGTSTAVSMTSAQGRQTIYSSATTAAGSSRTVTEPDGLSSQTTTDMAGTETTVLPQGVITTMSQAPDPQFGMMAPYVSSMSVRQSQTSPLFYSMSTTKTATPASGAVNRTETTSINGKISTTTYNAATRTTTITSPMGRHTVLTRDEKGRVVFKQQGTLAPTTTTYDSRGRVETMTMGSGGEARQVTLAYDALDRISGITMPLSPVRHLAYNLDSQPVSMGPDGFAVGLSRGPAGDIMSVTPPARPAHQFTYTLAGDQQSYTAPVVGGVPSSITYGYNLDSQPTSRSRLDGQAVGMTYDTAGRGSTMTYPAEAGNVAAGSVTTTRTYSPTTGKLVGLTTSDGEGLSFVYEGNLLLSATSTGSASGAVSMTYDNHFRVQSETAAGSSVSFGYDNDGLPTTVGALSITRHLANGLVTGTTLGNLTDTFAHNAFVEPMDYEAKYSGSTLLHQAFVRDGEGRIEQKTETIGGVTTIYQYSYDGAGRLWQVLVDGVLTATYLYDANGNRTSRVTPGETEVGTPDDQDRLSTYGKWAFTYAPDGELKTKVDTTTSGTTTYSYDGMGALRKVLLPDGRLIEYAVNADGRRVAKKVNGVVERRWIYGADQLYPVLELDGAGAVVSRFVGREYLVRGGSTYRMIKDNLGSVRLVVNVNTGTIAQRIDYDEYGRVLGDTAPGFQPFGFAGGIYDPDTRLVRFGARDYDPDTGRWTAKDPTRFRGGANFYAYSKNDPINFTDSTGLEPEWWTNFRELHMDRNRLNWCPPNEPREGYACNGRYWTKYRDGKYRADDGSECMYDENGNFVENGGSFNFGPDPFTFSHIFLDLLPWVIWGAQTPGLTTVR